MVDIHNTKPEDKVAETGRSPEMVTQIIAEWCTRNKDVYVWRGWMWLGGGGGLCLVENIIHICLIVLIMGFGYDQEQVGGGRVIRVE